MDESTNTQEGMMPEEQETVEGQTPAQEPQQDETAEAGE